MNSCTPTDAGRRLWPDLDATGFNYFDFLHAKGSPREALFYSGLFWPDLVEFEYIFRCGSAILNHDLGHSIGPMLPYDGTDRRDEKKGWHELEIQRLFRLDGTEIREDETVCLALQMAPIWHARLHQLFPRCTFETEVFMPNEPVRKDVAIRIHHQVDSRCAVEHRNTSVRKRAHLSQEAVKAAKLLWPHEMSSEYEYLDFVREYGSARRALFYSGLYWPEFVEMENMVFLASDVEDADDRRRVRETLTRMGEDRSEVEKAFNTVEVPFLFGSHLGETTDEEDESLARAIAVMWKARLENLFPDRLFVVEVLDADETTGEEVRVQFYQLRPGIGE